MFVTFDIYFLRVSIMILTSAMTLNAVVERFLRNSTLVLECDFNISISFTKTEIFL